jgi:acetyltransferase-like isoleucine patch superfamily enzyme
LNERLLEGVRNRVLQVLALYAPGAATLRPALHRLRGVQVGEGTFIGTDAIIETAHPRLVSLGDGVVIGIRSVIIAHFRSELADQEVEAPSGPTVRIEDDVFIGPGVIVLPNVTIGRGAVVNAGSVVTRSVPPMTMVQGNPAEPVARFTVPLGRQTPLKEFYRTLTVVRRPGGS